MSRAEAVQKFRSARQVAVITGAGISSESGIPTFRGAGGLWNNHRAEELATPEAFRRDPELVWRWYDWRRGICAAAEPNAAHRVVAEMNSHYPDFLLLTQNVDGLHGRAHQAVAAQGETFRAVELHGNIWKARCTSCSVVFDVPESPLAEIPVRCPTCAGLARPHIVWFGESYDPRVMQQAAAFLAATEAVLVVGTSGMVSIPVHLTQAAVQAGAYVVEANVESTAVTELADCVLQGKAGQELPRFWDEVAKT